MLTRSHLAGLAIIALLASMLGCGGASDGCVVDGKHHKAGEAFPSTDGCNTCTCGDDGSAECTAMACVRQCAYDGKTYLEGDSFPASDGCNTCSCVDGGVKCTDTPCVNTCAYHGKTHQPGDWFLAGSGCDRCTCVDGAPMCVSQPCNECTYGGEIYSTSESFLASDGCNTCNCQFDGGVGCTLTDCVATCTYADQSFPALDGCNTCTCDDLGSIGCTELSCACDPKKEWFRNYISVGTCEDPYINCPANTIAFKNDCGCGCEQDPSCPQSLDCMPPKQCDYGELHLECPYSEIAD